MPPPVAEPRPPPLPAARRRPPLPPWPPMLEAAGSMRRVDGPDEDGPDEDGPDEGGPDEDGGGPVLRGPPDARREPEPPVAPRNQDGGLAPDRDGPLRR
ncbi:hypothetical protein BIV57_09305 [Mangrovactinospora gilvigrisea]|uniref:Uncharacterized protein n=1 Tax=Mangrovactinospora gilvigrisea TaxID=1428644 RepID=A0A1J7BGI1_9ACTN|nr:hypothetical protein BIV57_09305 [Mangrovactinospora gilvigrisea]